MNDRPNSHDQDLDSVREQILLECEAMARHSLASGLGLPGSVAQALEPDRSPAKKQPTRQSTSSLARIHETLSHLVAPATPRTILLLQEESQKSGLLNFLGPVPLVRRMMLLSLIMLVTLLGLSLSADVSTAGVEAGMLDSKGLPLLINLLFLLSAAGLGASFSALFRANRFITEGTFDPKYESTYWVRFTLGLIAGIILAELIPLGANSETITKPMLAIVGGFSSDLVYRTLNRLVETVETLVRGQNKELLEAQALAERVRFQQLVAEGKSKLAADLMHLRQQLGAGVDPDKLADKLDRVLADIAPSDLAAGAAAATDEGDRARAGAAPSPAERAS